MKIIRVKAPVRIDFGGGWTDVPPFSDEKGGAVLNATITKYVEGQFVIDNKDRISVQYKSDIPVSSGLGTSATMNVVWLKLIKNELSPGDVAEKSFWLEKLLGIAGGRQDQYASAFGGINYMTFYLNYTEVHRLNVTDKFIKKLEDSMVLCYTGKSRLSSNIATEVMRNYKRGNKKTLSGLHQIWDAAHQMIRALEDGQLEDFAWLMKSNWEGQKKLAPGVSTPNIEDLFKKAFKAGAIAGKATGAGGGGSLLFIGDKAKITKALSKECQVIPFKFDFKGIQIKKTER